MHVTCSFRRIALVVALAVLGLAQPVSADQPHHFRARGTWAVSIEDTHLEGVRRGHANPHGPFTGQFSGLWVDGDGFGVGRLDFGRGDTFSYVWHVETDDATGFLYGIWVVTGGTGRYAGATGGGTSFAVPAGDGTGTFEYDGTLSY